MICYSEEPTQSVDSFANDTPLVQWSVYYSYSGEFQFVNGVDTFGIKTGGNISVPLSLKSSLHQNIPRLPLMQTKVCNSTSARWLLDGWFVPGADNISHFRVSLCAVWGVYTLRVAFEEAHLYLKQAEGHRYYQRGWRDGSEGVLLSEKNANTLLLNLERSLEDYFHQDYFTSLVIVWRPAQGEYTSMFSYNLRRNDNATITHS